MGKALVKEISVRQFDAYCYSRHPYLGMLSEEVKWFEASDRKLLGAVQLDYSDQDYGYIVLGRDKRMIFRWIDGNSSFKTIAEAEGALKKTLEKYAVDGNENYPQDDEKKPPSEFLKPQAKPEKLHNHFNILTQGPGYEAARNLIKEIVYTYIDVDGNYIKDFQSTGFDSRLWELYLYIYLHNSRFTINNDHHSPDFCVSYFGEECFIEAVTVQSNPDFDEKPPLTSEEVLLLSKDYMPIKYGSSLFSKTNKAPKYWDLPHVSGKPFVIAIHDFHMPSTLENLGSMTWSRLSLMDYLYGVRIVRKLDQNGDIAMDYEEDDDWFKPKTEELVEHKWKHKTIPSNFFGLPGNENVSAILFSNNATLATFNRMGKLAGIGSSDIKMIRKGFRYNPDPDGPFELPFTEDLDNPRYEESWSDGLIMYHNPNAKVPVDPSWFHNISHVFYEKDSKELVAHLQPYDVLSSYTMIVKGTR